MENTLSEVLQPIVGLAKARELLIMDRQSHMPRGAGAQRDKMIAAMEHAIGDALAATAERLPEPDASLDEVSRRAWEYVAQAQSHVTTTPPLQSAYANLQRRFEDKSNLSLAAADGGEGILEWIQLTHSLPQVKDAVIDEAKASVAVFIHRSLTQPDVRQWIEDVKANPDGLTENDRRNFALMEQQWREAAGLDEKLVGDLSRVTSVSQRVWEESKPTGDFAAWLPHFEEMVKLTRRKGEALSQGSGDTPYQALLGSAAFNKGLRNETVNKVFGQLRTQLPALIQTVMQKQSTEEPPLPLPPVAVDDQLRVAKRLMRELGLTEDHVRLDKSAHPFSTGQWDDVRITTRYREDDMMPALMGVVHEAGHALYSRALPREVKGQPVGEPQSTWVHETQSLFWEMQVAGSREFMALLSRIIKEELNVDGPEWSADNLHKLITHVQPSLIRVDADEVTYPVHVILRHDLEQKLIDGTLAPKDVPAAWNKGMKEMLGVDVPNDSVGCMQDTHWPSGLIGYFPGYTFGALGAAQLMEKARQDMPDIGEHIEKGDFAPIREWLREHVHQHGSHYSGEELIEQATGKPLSADAWLNYIQERYLGQEVAADTKWQAAQSRRAAGGGRVFPG